MSFFPQEGFTTRSRLVRLNQQLKSVLVGVTLLSLYPTTSVCAEQLLVTTKLFRATKNNDKSLSYLQTSGDSVINNS